MPKKKSSRPGPQFDLLGTAALRFVGCYYFELSLYIPWICLAVCFYVDDYYVIRVYRLCLLQFFK